MKLNIGQRILAIVIIPFILFSSFFIYITYVNTTKDLMYEKKLSIQYVVQTAMTIVRHYQTTVKNGELTEGDAKKFAIEAINKIRYGVDNDDYLWINDVHPKMVSHPSVKLVGQDLSNFKDKVGDKIFVKMVDVAKKSGDGYVQYIWASKKDKNIFVPKLSYIRLDKEWGWIIGTGIYIDSVDRAIRSILLKNIAIVVVTMAIIIVCISFVIKRNIRIPLLNIAEKLTNTSELVSSGAGESLKNCSHLSSSSQDQAASLQQTVSSVAQINAMISRNAISAQESKDTSLQSQKSANTGKKRIDEMLVTIEDISENNDKVIDRMKTTNDEVNEILNIIKDINEKTKVINDIVFQTKLLSFNASVEAARAGESGKGFAVVAEEIGALANMSGKASDDIRTLIENSMAKVEEIVGSTTSVMDKMIEEGSTAVDKGKERARECKVVLDEIIGNVDKVNIKVSEIAGASQEQSQGVDEISKAMELLDQVSHKNNNAVLETEKSSKGLQNEALALVDIVDEVKEMVIGNKAS
jgi:methyl-accepting chemotaxis protein